MDLNLTNFRLATLGLAAIGSFAIPVLVAFWLSKSRLNWLLQSLVILIVAWPLALVRACDLMLVTLVTGFTVLISSNIGTGNRERELAEKNEFAIKTRFQFDLKNTLAAFGLVVCFAALLAQANRSAVWAADTNSNSWAVVHCVTIGLAVAAWSMSWLVFRGLKYRYWPLWSALLVVLLIATGSNVFTASKLVQACEWIQTDEFSGLQFRPEISKTESVLGWMILLFSVAMVVSPAIWLGGNWPKRFSGQETELSGSFSRNWFRYLKRSVGGLLVLSLVLATGNYCLLLLPPARYSPKQQAISGKVNSFPDLIAIGASLSAAELSDYPPLKPGSELTEKIRGQSKAFLDLELALQAENCHCVDWDSVDPNISTVLENGSQLRAISRALSCRSLQALSEGRADDVLADGLIGLKLGDRIAFDGTYIHSLLGTACEGIGLGITRSGLEGASRKQLENAAKQLDEQKSLFGTIDAEMKRLTEADCYYMSNDKTIYWLDSALVNLRSDLLPHDSIRAMLIRRNVLRELLRTEIAIVLFNKEIGEYPNDLAALVPKYISSIPADQYSPDEAQPMSYVVRPDRKNYQLYSYGKDGDDDGGKVDKFQWTEQSDIDLKVLYGDRLADHEKEVQEYEAEEARRLAEEAEWEKELEEMNEEDYDEFGEVFDDLTEEE